MDESTVSKAGALVGEVMDGIDVALPGVAKTSVTTFDTLFWSADGSLTSVGVLIIAGIPFGYCFRSWNGYDKPIISLMFLNLAIVIFINRL